MPSNILKRLTRPKAEPYRFPDASELTVSGDLEEAPEQLPQSGLEAFEEPEDAPEEAVSDPEEEPVSFAKIQAEKILEEARAEAQELIRQGESQALAQAEDIRLAAQEAGRQEGYQQGLSQGRQEAALQREEQAKRLEEEVQAFFDQAGLALDRQLEQNVDQLRDLSLAIAEKVISVSLRSSADVVGRMIQTAVEKRKKREWVHIYIAECDARRMGQIPAALASALQTLSDRVRIIPMADDESGTCVIEMPDEIIDASASTQLNNIRSLLMDTPTGGPAPFTGVASSGSGLGGEAIPGGDLFSTGGGVLR